MNHTSSNGTIKNNKICIIWTFSMGNQTQLLLLKQIFLGSNATSNSHPVDHSKCRQTA